MQIVICPGVHPGALTADFVKALALPNAFAHTLVLPADCPVYSGWHIVRFLQSALSPYPHPSWGTSAGAACPQDIPTPTPHAYLASPPNPLLFISFSAGVVGAITAARLWQSMGGYVAGLAAVDGWGVPLFASFPICRISHDAFTHWSSALLGAGQSSFYAEPAVAHLNLWRSPQMATGWAIQPGKAYQTNAAEFLQAWLQKLTVSDDDHS